MQELDKILEEIDETIDRYKENANVEAVDICYGIKIAKKIIRNHMNDGWISVNERSPFGYERIGYDKQGNKYMRRLEIAYMTDTIEYIHGYYDGYKWMDKWHDIIKNVIAWKIHEPYRPERNEGE